MEARIRAEIASQGPIPFERFVELALYDPEFGFYSSGGQAGGRRGDFVTSVEMGPLFGSIVGDWLDRHWRAAGEPDEFHVAEAGAGVGTLYRAIARSNPACFDALRYSLVEQSALLRESHESLPGEQWRSVSELPTSRQHVVIANELLDNLPFGIAEKTEQGWRQVLVDISDDDLDLVCSDWPAALAPDVGVEAPLGSRVPVATSARAWVDTAVALADSVLVFDYGAPTSELARRDGGWLRTYADHQRGNDPLASIGALDITHDVPIDQLPTPAAVQTQSEWLQANGLDVRRDEAARVWQERAHIGDLEAMVARSAINEAKALIDPTGLGSFYAIAWGATLDG